MSKVAATRNPAMNVMMREVRSGVKLKIDQCSSGRVTGEEDEGSILDLIYQKAWSSLTFTILH